MPLLVPLLVSLCLLPAGSVGSSATDLFLTPFDQAWTALVEQRTAGRTAPPELLATLTEQLPEDEPRRARLAADVATLRDLPPGRVADLGRLVASPSKLLRRGPDGATVDLDPAPLDRALADLADRHGTLLARWLGRASLSWTRLHEADVAVDRSQLAVLLATRHGDATDRALAHLSRLTCLVRNLRLDGPWAGLIQADAAAVANQAALADQPAWAASARLRRVSFQGLTEPVGALAGLGELASDPDNPPEVRAQALGLRLESLIVLADWGRAAEDAEALEALLADRPAHPLLMVPWRALGLYHRDRLDEPGQPSSVRRAVATAAFERARDLAPTEVDRALVLEWLSSTQASSGAIEAARRSLDEALTVLEGGVIPFALPRLLGHAAWIELQAGAPRRALAHLDQQATLLPPDALPMHADHYRIRARAAHALADLPGVLAALMALLVIEDRQIAQTPGELQGFPAAESVETHGFLVETLVELVEDGVPVASLYPLAEAIVEHGRARLLRQALRGGQAALGPPDVLAATELGRAPLASLPEGWVELRWFLGRSLSLGEVDTYIQMARRGDELVLRSLGPRSALDERVGSFLERWMVPEALARDAPSFLAEAGPLSETLLGPARSWLAQGDLRRVLLMPDGILERLPFGALLIRTPASAPGSFAELPYLVRVAPLVLVPSRAILRALPAPAASTAALGVLGARDDRRLTFAGDELAAVGQAHPDSELLDGDDTGAASLSSHLATGRHGWLHLATHASPAADDRAAASLRLPDGARLSASAVRGLPLPRGTRVVLSACGTATGAFLRGEGVLGLWRAFVLAGASCVVSTLTEVDDRSAATWMTSFHRHAAAGRPVADAARQASLDWLEGRARPDFPRGAALDPDHPFLWSVFVCLGRDEVPLP